MIKISVQDFDIISQYKLICNHCGKLMLFKDHPLDIVDIHCPICKTKYCLSEENEIEEC